MISGKKAQSGTSSCDIPQHPVALCAELSPNLGDGRDQAAAA